MVEAAVFKCPKCGGPYFGRDILPHQEGRAGVVDVVMDAQGFPLDVMETVRCHGGSSESPWKCDWRGIYLGNSSEQQSKGGNDER